VEIALAVVSIFLIVSTLFPLVSSPWWWVRIFDFPQLQLAGLLLLAIIANLVFFRAEVLSDYMILTALVACFGYTFHIIFPYTPLAKPKTLSAARVTQKVTTDQNSSISLLSANVYMYNRDADSLKELIKEQNPDVVLLLETNQWWVDQLRPLTNTYQYFKEVPKENTYGMVLYSKLPLSNTRVNYLIEPDVPSIDTEIKLREGTEVKLHCLHPRPPAPTERKTSTPRDAELMLVAKSAGFNDIPTIVAGDLNDVAWSHTTRLFQRVSGMLDPRIGRGFFNTFHAKYPIFRWPLDHLFHSDSFFLMEIKRLGAIGSDHFPILVKLLYQNGAEDLHETPEPENGDMEEAQQMITNGKNLE